ncbi:sulfotransferase family protein [Taklimakanibacter deserti]|uniref:sulfotransferase family protein n=1 Tax=Taklimakanibacter deserti TaxID=2267839 RepID=UPI0013C41A53
MNANRNTGANVKSTTLGCLEKFCAAARRSTGLADFGDPYYRTGLRILLRSLRREAQLTFIGRMLLGRSIATAVEQRLMIQHLRRTEPQIFKGRLMPPVIITGMPRSGTTFLHRLLAADPAMRAPVLNELLEPVPRGSDWRRRWLDLRLKCELAVMRLFNRGLDARHFTRGEEPEECMFALAISFRTVLPWTLAPVHSYLAWLSTADRRQKYREYRDILCLLQRRDQERRLLLKAPDHLGGVAELLAAVPEALIVVCRRDPVVALTSLNSLLDGVHKVTSRASDRAALGQSNLAFYAAETGRYLSAYATWRGHILEVDYETLTRQPLEVARRVCERLGLAIESGLARRFQEFIANNPKDKHGRHLYSPSDYAQTAEGLRRNLAHYG